jgi:hypothetical protein
MRDAGCDILWVSSLHLKESSNQHWKALAGDMDSVLTLKVQDSSPLGGQPAGLVGQGRRMDVFEIHVDVHKILEHFLTYFYSWLCAFAALLESSSPQYNTYSPCPKLVHEFLIGVL